MSWMHRAINCSLSRLTSCTIKSEEDSMKIAGWYSGRNHHELLHNGGTEYCDAQDSDSKLRRDQVPVKYQCPLCKNFHTYAWQSGLVFSSRRLTSCPMFANKEPGQRCEALRKLGGCRLCTRRTHNSAKCPMRYKRQCGGTTTESMCGEWHHHSLPTAGPSHLTG